MSALWNVADSNIKVITPAAGIYTGIESIIEYITLVVEVANNGYLFFSESGSLSNFKYFPTNSSYSFESTQKACLEIGRLFFCG